MKRLGAMLVVASLGAILALHGRASAALPCPAGCGGQKKACVQTAGVKCLRSLTGRTPHLFSLTAAQARESL